MKRPVRMPLLALLSLLFLLISGAAFHSEAAAVPAAKPAERPERLEGLERLERGQRGELAQRSERPVLNGTFIQLLEENGKWNSTRWERLFDFFQSVGLTEVVVQWSLLDSSAFHVPNSGEPLAPVGMILEAAESRGIDVYLGLAAESRYWEMIKQPPAGQEEYLRQLRLKSERVAREVAPLAAKYQAFKGWYISEEIDDLSWRAPRSRQVLYRHLKELSSNLKKLTPGDEVLLSAFSNARMSPDSFQEFWRDLLRESSIDILLFQDGAGVGKLPEELLPVYLKAVRAATDASKKKLQVVVELFETVSESPFAARPAPFRRVARQLETAGRFASGGINAFSVPDYMSHDGSAAAKELSEGYLRYKLGRESDSGRE